MFEKILDLKNTFEGKFLAVLMTVVLVLGLSNFAAFAEGDSNGVSGDAAVATSDGAAQGADATASDVTVATDSGGTANAPLVTEASVTFETENAYVAVKGQVLSGTKLTTELNKDLEFAASADTGYEISEIKAYTATTADVPVLTQGDVSVVAANYVDSTLTIVVTAAAVQGSQPATSETTPITEGSVIDSSGGTVAGGAAAESAGAESTDGEVELSQSVNGTIVTLKAPAGVLPAGATMKAIPLEDEAVRQIAEEKAASEGKKLVSYVAFDVTLYSAAGNEIQPNGTVKLAVASPSLNPESTSIYHSESDVAACQKVADGTEATLSHLSPIIALDAIEAQLHTVTFTVQGSSSSTQAVAEGETCIEPLTPAIPAGFVSFLGWYQKMADGSLSAARFDFATPIETDTELVAKFSDKWAVLFVDAGGKVIETQEVANNGKAVNNVSPTPPSGQTLDGWFLNGQPYDFNTPVTQSIVLTPNFVDSSYVYFISKGSAVDPQIVRSGDVAREPANPTREGYAFKFWSTSEDGSAGSFDFSRPITADTMLYGIWAGKTVSYTVVYNFENANIAGDAGTNPANYSFNQQASYTAQAGSTVAAASLTLTPAAGDMTKYGYFAFGDTATISGTGTTVLNVYYKRTAYTVQFDLNGANTYKMAFNGSVYSGSGAKYSFAAKYEQNIDSLWVSSKNATFTSTDGKGFAGWTGFVSTFVTHRLTMTTDIIDRANASNVITAKASWASVKTVKVNYWLEVADPARLPADAKQMDNGKYYSALNEYTQNLTLQSNSTLGAKTIGGFSKHDSYNTNGTTSTTVYNFYYDRASFKLSFNTMGGSALASSTVLFEAPMATYKPADPTRANYVFAGWYLDSDHMIKYDFNTATMPGSNVQLYAKWESSQYTASFYAHEGDGVPVAVNGIAQGEYVKDPGTYIVGQGYEGLGEFLGWYWYLPGTDRLVAYSWETPVAGNVGLYAQWKTHGFTLIYDKGIGQGSVPLDGNSYAVGVSAPVKGALLTAAGKTFVGWQINGVGRTYYPGNTVKMNGTTKLVARYIDPSLAVSLTFKSNYVGGPSAETWTAEKNDQVTLPDSMFTRAGYAFTGWNTATDGSGKSYSASDVLTVASNVVLHAQWREADPVVIAYEAEDHGSVGRASENVAPVTGNPQGSTATADNNYVFQGWYCGSQQVTDGGKATLSKSDIDTFAKDSRGLYVATVFTAKFAPATVTLNFSTNGGSTVIASPTGLYDTQFKAEQTVALDVDAAKRLLKNGYLNAHPDCSVTIEALEACVSMEDIHSLGFTFAFDGWYSDPENGGYPLALGSDMATTAVTYKAAAERPNKFTGKQETVCMRIML